MKMLSNRQLLFIPAIVGLILCGLSLGEPVSASSNSVSGQAPPVSPVDIEKNFGAMHPFSQAEHAAQGSSNGPPQPAEMAEHELQFIPPTGPLYSQPEKDTTIHAADSKETAAYKTGVPLTGQPIDDAKLTALLHEKLSRFVDQMKDPNYLRSTALNIGQTLVGAGGNAVGSAANEASNSAFNEVMGGSGGGAGGAGGGGGGGGGGGPGDFSGFGGLINIANEASGIPTSPYIPFKIVPQAVWMVQQMYKQVFIPMAILFLLVGAVITQTKAQISAGFNLKADDASSPFEGILRAMVALFLVFSTQLIVSYSIDVGNSMAASVAGYVDLQAITTWAQTLNYVPQQSLNQLPPSGGGGGGEDVQGMASSGNWGGLASAGGGGSGGGGSGGGLGGLASDQPAASAVSEQVSFLSQGMASLFNTIAFLFSMGLVILGAFQLVYMCYLYLLGPLSAAFYAWPTVQGKLFRTIFGNWLNAVIVLSLWRFYWMVILAIMTLRLFYMSDHGGIFNLEFEVAVYTCLIGLMFYIPMSPWNFDPGQAYMTAKDIGEQLMSGAKGGGGDGGDGGGGGGGGGGGEDNDLDPEKNSAHSQQGQQAHGPQSPGEHHNESTNVPNPPPGSEPGEADLEARTDSKATSGGAPEPGIPSDHQPPNELISDNDSPAVTNSIVNDVPTETAQTGALPVADTGGPPLPTMPDQPGAVQNPHVNNAADLKMAAMDFTPILDSGASGASMATQPADGAMGLDLAQGNPPTAQGQV